MTSDPIREVWERNAPLHSVLSDKQWMIPDGDPCESKIIPAICYELWTAICAEMERRENGTPCVWCEEDTVPLFICSKCGGVKTKPIDVDLEEVSQ